MRLRVLGSAAGGGFPQWNCNCRNCDGLRRGTIAATPRTQSSISASVEGGQWVLFNASPDLLAQIRGFAALQPGRAVRDTALADIVLVDAQLDHTLGLLLLREGGPFRIWCTDRVRDELSTTFPVFRLLEHYSGVDWRRIPIEPGSSFVLPSLGRVRCAAVPIHGNAPPFSRARDAVAPGDNIGIQLTDERTGQTLFYSPGLGAVGPAVMHHLQDADVLLVDGTFWSDDELIELGVSKRRARDMGHLPQSGPGGMLELLGTLHARRKILIHINNTNPILDERSPERARLLAAGIEIAYDGMEIDV